jgi:hypothetical protein
MYKTPAWFNTFMKVKRLSLQKTLQFLNWCWEPQRRLLSIIVLGQVLIVLCAIATRSQGVIKPVGKEVVEAYELLKQTPTGRKLIRNVAKVSRGNVIYLTLGETGRDRLYDDRGRMVKGLTRVNFQMSGTSCRVGRTIVIANNDVVRSDAKEIVKSLAFELENVYQVYDRSCACPLKDSPLAYSTQARIIEELGL